MRLAICVPSGGHPTLGFTNSLANLLININVSNKKRNQASIIQRIFDRNQGNDIEATCLFVSSSQIHRNREALVDLSQQINAEYTLWIDDDMAFEPEAFFYMLDRNEDFVACNYPRRSPPIFSTAHYTDGISLVKTSHQSSGLEKVGGVGFGLALIKSHVFKKLDKPLFSPIWDDAHKCFIGEDIYFCNKVTGAGMSIYVDQDASKLIGHKGDRIYTFEDIKDA